MTESMIERLREAITESERIIIGAGAGLSTSAGLTYDGERFRDYFSDFEEKYHFHDMYSGGFYPYDTPEERWAFWSRNVLVNRYCDIPKPVYDDLLKIVRDKNYFVITTNVDHCFQRSGFDKSRLFYTQGDYGLFQCSLPCHMKTYDNEDIISKMVVLQEDLKIPSELIPHCPVCGREMSMNLRSDDSFVEDEGWQKAAERYMKFLNESENQRTLFLELGVGRNTPVIIKYPFWRMTLERRNSIYACVNFGEASCPKEISERSICINHDIGEVLKELI